jgi:hypothetical protein
MRYLCLIFNETPPLAPEEEATLIAEHLAHDEELRQRGHFLVADALQPPESAMLVRVRKGKASITDGPFAETKELTGFYLIEARDLNEALRLASEIPAARHGCIEVRPIRLIN